MIYPLYIDIPRATVAHKSRVQQVLVAQPWACPGNWALVLKCCDGEMEFTIQITSLNHFNRENEVLNPLKMRGKPILREK